MSRLPLPHQEEKVNERKQRGGVSHRIIEDSTVLAYIMKLLNERHDYGLNLMLLSIDEGITGYRDDSLEVQ